MARHSGLWPGLAITRDRTVDDSRIDRAHGLISQSEPLHHAGAELLDQDIGLLKQGTQNIERVLRFQINGH